MPELTDRRSRKRLATRQAISNVATRLFFERGFDNVTIDQIAEAADVGRMTVFNHFPRKEDLFFDRDGEMREIMREAILRRDPLVSPVEALRLLAHRLAAQESPFVEFSPQSERFVLAIQRSEPLMARARAIGQEMAQTLCEVLARGVEGAPTDPDAMLAAGLLVATWSVAFLQAHASYRQTRDSDLASADFLSIIDKGFVGVKAALASSPYA